jgi:hypothetical protein
LAIDDDDDDDDEDDDDDSHVACVAHMFSNTTPEDSTSSQVEWRLQRLIDTTTISNVTQLLLIATM